MLSSPFFPAFLVKKQKQSKQTIKSWLSQSNQACICLHSVLMLETREHKPTPTNGGTMHASLQIAKGKALSYVVVYRLNFLSEMVLVYIWVCVCVYTIETDCCIMHSLQTTNKAFVQYSQPNCLSASWRWSYYTCRNLSSAYFVSAGPKTTAHTHTQRSYSLKGASRADRAHWV